MSTKQNKRRRENSSNDSSSSDSEDEVRSRSGFWASWLVVEGTETERPLSALSPFAIQKGFQCVSGNPKSIKRLRDGTYLVECLSKKQSDQLLKATKLVDRAIKVSPHKGLNSTKGVIRCPDLKGVPELEIKKELKSQGVIEVRRAMFRKGADLLPTNTIFLTFCTQTLPQSIKVGYLNVKVSLYVPSPMRCFKCQKFGHVRDRCPGVEVCGVCSKAAHGEPCEGPAHCVNCGGDHPSSSRDCPTWIMEQAVQRVKTERKLPFFEARKIVQSSRPTQRSYAAALKTKMTSVSCQTDISWLSEKMKFVKETTEGKKTMFGGGNKSANTQTDQTEEKKMCAPGGGNKSVNPSAPGRGPKSAIPQAAQQPTKTAQAAQQPTKTGGDPPKPPVPPRPLAGSSARAGRGGHRVVMVDMGAMSPTTPKVKPSGPTGGPTSGRQRKGDDQNSNRYLPLQEKDEEQLME